jgi:hypothetical protein
MKILAPAFALTLLCLSICAHADDEHEAVKFSPSHFSDQRGDIVESLDGKQYYEITDEAKQQVLQALDRMQAKLQDVTSVDQLSEADKVAVFNDQELINNLLTEAAADSRLICKREKTLGSNMRSNSCLSVAERRRRQEEDQDKMRRIQRSGYLPPAN